MAKINNASPPPPPAPNQCTPPNTTACTSAAIAGRQASARQAKTKPKPQDDLFGQRKQQRQPQQAKQIVGAD
ncbi:hypothetical protein [Xanthomonas campestris]|uniref:hypothetical protein n=1 Tax=Xanthomonas campestris TaxID=339 RepID=UPI0024B80200|nr:hypothetical protein [Xanthomonas campestris]WHO91825.1 hypothetical protein QMY62_16335 [Xanthomonas campestris]